MDKLATVRPSVEGLPHGEGSAKWLETQGYAELGPAVAAHPVTRLADAGWFERWIATASLETLIVAYADKRAGQRLESMADRFGSWMRRYPPDETGTRGWSTATVEGVRRRAEEIERRACGASGVRPDDVRRLEWTGPAIGRAARSDAGGQRDAALAAASHSRAGR